MWRKATCPGRKEWALQVVHDQRPLPSEEETAEKVCRNLTVKPRPESGIDWLMCGILARQRLGLWDQILQVLDLLLELARIR